MSVINTVRKLSYLLAVVSLGAFAACTQSADDGGGCETEDDCRNERVCNSSGECVRQSSDEAYTSGGDETGDATASDGRGGGEGQAAESDADVGSGGGVNTGPGPHPDASPTGFKSVGSGPHYSCGVTASGDIDCWGRDEYGLLDPPSADGYYDEVAPGSETACAVTDVNVYCWGSDEHGLVSDAPDNESGERYYKHPTVGTDHACVIEKPIAVSCWGNNDVGQLDTPADTKFRMISAGDQFSCGITTDEELVCWGDAKTSHASPPSGTFQDVDVGFARSCAITIEDAFSEPGAIECWGETKGTPPSGENFEQVEVGRLTACARTESGTIECWGDSIEQPPSGEFMDLGCGKSYCCATQPHKKTKCWGDVRHGEMNPPK